MNSPGGMTTISGHQGASTSRNTVPGSIKMTRALPGAFASVGTSPCLGWSWSSIRLFALGHSSAAGAGDLSCELVERCPDGLGAEGTEADRPPVVPLPLVDRCRQRVGRAQVRIFQSITVDVVDRQDEILAAMVGLGPEEFLEFIAAGLAREVARRDDRDEETGLVEYLIQLIGPALPDLDVVDVLKDLERLACHLLHGMLRGAGETH